jgi:predicted dehydrogenase
LINRALVGGLGSIGQRHLRLLRSALPLADIRVLRHSGCDTPNKYADGCFDKLAAACDFSPELAIIASPAPFHLPTAFALTKVGTHLLIEKPISVGAANVARLIQICTEQRRQLQVGYNLRFMETLQLFRSKISAGTIGSIRIVRCEIGQYLPNWRQDIDYRNTVSAQAKLGGGALLELSHELDMLRWIFGEVDWLSAWKGRQGRFDIDVEDSVFIQMGFANGAVAQLSMDFLRHDTTRVCTAIGDMGTMRWDAVAGTVSHFDAQTGIWIDLLRASPQKDDTYAAQINVLLTAIAEGMPSKIAAQGADGLAVMHIIEAVHASDAASGRRISLEQLL